MKYTQNQESKVVKENEQIWFEGKEHYNRAD